MDNTGIKGVSSSDPQFLISSPHPLSSSPRHRASSSRPSPDHHQAVAPRSGCNSCAKPAPVSPPFLPTGHVLADVLSARLSGWTDVTADVMEFNPFWIRIPLSSVIWITMASVSIGVVYGKWSCCCSDVGASHTISSYVIQHLCKSYNMSEIVHHRPLR